MNASNQEVVDLILSVIASELDIEAIAAWLQVHSTAK
jgi:prophage maintenance system killer protein